MNTRTRLAWLLVGAFACAHASVTALAAAAAPPAAAEDAPKLCPICRHANKPSAPYAEHASSTLARGALNTAFGWTELLVQPASEVEHSGNLITGVGKGVSHALKRTAQGVGELVTFWAPRSAQHPESMVTDCPICRAALAPPAAPSPGAKAIEAERSAGTSRVPAAQKSR